MGKSAKKSAFKVEAAPVVVTPGKPLKKEEAIDKKVVSAKKQKVEVKKSEVKPEKKIPKKKVDDDSSSDEELPKAKAKNAKNGKVDSDSDDDSSGLEEASAPKKARATAKKGKAAPKNKDKDSSSSDDETSSDEEAASSSDDSSSDDESDDDDSSSESDSDDETSSDEDVEASKKAPAKNGVVAAKKKAESSSDDESSDEEVVPAKSAPKKKDDSSDESDSDDESSDEEETPDDSDSSEESEDEEPKTIAKKSSSEESSEEDDEDEKPAKVAKNVKMVDATPKPGSNGTKTLFVGNLSFNVEQADVDNFFRHAGEVVDVRFAMKDGEFRGFGHVEFATAEGADKALHELNGQDLFNRPVRLDLARQRGEYTPSFSGGRQTAFVRGFDRNSSEEEIRSGLEEHFGSCGETTRLSGGTVKGIAYIDFKDSSAFAKALELNGSHFGECSLYVDEAKPRDNSGGRGKSGGFGGDSGGRFGGGRGGRFGNSGRGGRFGNSRHSMANFNDE